jgi:hypothetical protein
MVCNLTVGPVRPRYSARRGTAGESPMPDQMLLSLAREARAHAQEILAKTETFKDADGKQRMCEIAEKYVGLAERPEHAAAV